MTTFELTEEQRHIVDLFETGENLAIEAGAGTGKTSTLIAIAERAALKRRTGLYLAFNKAIVTDAGEKLPPNVKAKTAHSLAFGAVGRRYAARMNSSKRMRSEDIADILDIRHFNITATLRRADGSIFDDNRSLAPGFLAGHVMRGIAAFCNSADAAPGPKHIPYIDGIDAKDEFGQRTYKNNDILRDYLSDFLLAAWKDITAIDGALPFKHDHYLKIWQLSNPRLNYDFILFDEAQDASPVMRAIVESQLHAQLVVVGDSQQAIYEWRGAINALAEFHGNRAFLTHSFRFGPAIADAANTVLELLAAELRLIGRGGPSKTGRHESPNTVLCRTNAGAITEVLIAMRAGKDVALVGGGKEIESFCRGAQRLMEGKRTDHYELACFASWGEVEFYVENDPAGSELRLFVKLIREFGIETILDAVGRTIPENRADLIVSTAHKAKGREWDIVRLGPDFMEPSEDDQISGPELRLLYVSVTRAKHHLDFTLCGALCELLEPDGGEREAGIADALVAEAEAVLRDAEPAPRTPLEAMNDLAESKGLGRPVDEEPEGRPISNEEYMASQCDPGPLGARGATGPDEARAIEIVPPLVEGAPSTTSLETAVPGSLVAGAFYRSQATGNVRAHYGEVIHFAHVDHRYVDKNHPERGKSLVWAKPVCGTKEGRIEAPGRAAVAHRKVMLPLCTKCQGKIDRGEL